MHEHWISHERDVGIGVDRPVPPHMPPTTEGSKEGIFLSYEILIADDRFPQNGSEEKKGEYHTQLLDLAPLESGSDQKIIRPEQEGKSVVRVYQKLKPNGEPALYYLEVGITGKNLVEVFLDEEGSPVVDPKSAESWHKYNLN